jgi:histidine triad (HIT) family protein
MNDCIFCKLINGEIPIYNVYEDKYVLAFLDRTPINPGHTIIIPKKHSETILDTDDETLKKLAIATKKISSAIYESLNLEGFNIVSNQFRVAGQVVPHLHIHIMPRHKDDGVRLWPTREYESEEVKKEVLEKIRKVLK